MAEARGYRDTFRALRGAGLAHCLPVWRKAFGRPDCVAGRLGCPVDAPVLRGTVAFGGHAPGTGAGRPAVRG